MEPVQRPLLGPLVALATGSLFGAGELPLGALIGATLAVLLFLIRSSSNPWNALVWGFILGSCVGLAAARTHFMLAEHRQNLEAADSVAPQRNLAITATVSSTETADAEDKKHVAILRDVEVRGSSLAVALRGNFRVWVSTDDQVGHFVQLSALNPGARITFRGRVQTIPNRRNFHAPNPRRLAAVQGIAGRIIIDWPTVRVLTSDGGGWELSSLLSTLRDSLAAQLAKGPSPENFGRLRAFLLNDYQLMDRTELAHLRTAGLLHLYAISGSHFATFAAILLVLLRVLMPLRVAAMSTALVLLLYLAVLAYPPAATRAWVMVAAVAVSWLRRRESDLFSAWILAAFLMILLDPLVVLNRGFLLSFAGALGVMTAANLVMIARQDDPPTTSRERMVSAVRAMAAVSIGAAFFVIPLQLFFFQTLHLLSPVSNIIGNVMTGLALLLSFSGLMVGMVVPLVGQGLFGLAGLLLEGLSAWAGMVSAWEGLVYRPHIPPVAAVAAAYGLLLSGPYLVFRSSPEYAAKAGARLLTVGLASILIVAVGSAAASWTGGKSRITVFDVGQGDSTLIELPDGQAFLVDGGHVAAIQGFPVIPAEIRARGHAGLPAAVATHVDADHIGGLPAVLREFPLPALIEASPESTATLALAMRDAAIRRPRPIPVLMAHAGDVLASGRGWSLAVLHPPPPSPGAPPRNPAKAGRNDDSIVLLLEHGQFRMLLMGDAPDYIEQDLLTRGLVPTVTVLRLGHHGSKTSSAPEFLDATAPTMAIASCGENNIYGHPSHEVVRRLEQRAIPLLRTDRDGAIRITTDGGRWHVETAAAHLSYPSRRE